MMIQFLAACCLAEVEKRGDLNPWCVADTCFADVKVVSMQNISDSDQGSSSLPECP